MSTTVTGERLADGGEEQAVRSPRRAWWPDALIAVGLAFIALLYRLHFPRDGLFFDDAWQAFAAAKGSFSQLLTVGQTQPGFGLTLMVWSRVFGQATVSMITPALIAGTLGPPALYLALRRFHFARSIAVLLGSALVVSTTHIVYSGRVKAYTAEVLVVLAFTVIVPWLAHRTWTASTALGWVVGSMAAAFFSSFALLATVGAAIVLVLHPRRDRRLREVAIGCQAVGILLLLAVVNQTHSARALNDFFKVHGGFIAVSLNPITFAREVFHHFTQITAMFPGGPAWFTVVTLALAAIGLVTAARWSSSRAIAARFMIVLVLLAFLGSIARRVPFGPNSDNLRVVLWMVPIVAFGLAVVLGRLRRALAGRGKGAAIAFDVAVFVCAALLLTTPIGVRRPYPSGAQAATKRVLPTIGPSDVVLITRPAMYSVAFYADTPVRVQEAPGLIQGMLPRFADRRIVPVNSLSKAQLVTVDHALASADRVFVIDSNNDPTGYRTYRAQLNDELTKQGFKRGQVSRAQRATIAVWHRTKLPARL